MYVCRGMHEMFSYNNRVFRERKRGEREMGERERVKNGLLRKLKNMRKKLFELAKK